MMSDEILSLTRQQLESIVGTQDTNAIRTLELLLGLANDIPSLQDGVSGNTLSIATLSDVLRPMTIDPVIPISSPVSGDTTHNLTRTVEGVQLVYIAASNLVASAGGPFTLTITTGSGNTAKVPIAPAGLTISSGNLLFDIYVDESGNVENKAWIIEGTDGSAFYTQYHTGGMTAHVRLSAGTATETWTFPFPFIATPDVEATSSAALPRFVSASNTSTTAVDTMGWADTGAVSTTVRTASAAGRWRA